MNNTKTMKTGVQLGTNYRRELFMLGFSTKHEVMNFVRTQCTQEDQDRLPEILQVWESIQPRVRHLVQTEANILKSFSLEEIPTEFHYRLKEIEEHSLFQGSFSYSPHQFAIVEIDRLVAAQRSVDPNHIENLVKGWGTPPDFENLLEICLSPEGQRPSIQHLESGGSLHLFSSPDPDLRYLGTYMKKVLPEEYGQARGGHPVAAIVSMIGYGAAPIQVLNGGNRLIINNGFHRIYALRSMGIRKIPVVVQNFENVGLEFPDRVVGLPKDYLLHFNRPVLIKDYFEEGLTFELKIKQLLRTIQIHSSASIFETPY